MKATWRPSRTTSGAVTLAAVASFDTWAVVFSGNDATEERDAGADPGKAGLNGAVFAQMAEWPRQPSARRAGEG